MSLFRKTALTIAIALAAISLAPAQATAATSLSLTYSSSTFAGNRTVQLPYSTTDTAISAARRECARMGLNQPSDNSSIVKIVDRNARVFDSVDRPGGKFSVAAFMTLNGDRVFAQRACDGGQIN